MKMLTMTSFNELQAAQNEIIRLQNYIAGQENMLSSVFEETQRLWEVNAEHYEDLEAEYTDLKMKYDNVVKAERQTASRLTQVLNMQSARDDIITELRNLLQYYKDIAAQARQDLVRLQAIIDDQGQELLALQAEYQQNHITDLKQTKLIIEASRVALARSEAKVAELQEELQRQQEASADDAVNELQRVNRGLKTRIQQLQNEFIDLQDSSEQLLQEQYDTIRRLRRDANYRESEV